MKPAPFAYDAPETLHDALGLLAEHGPDAKPLAGGQSLVPMMSFRLARPRRLIDLNRIGELAYVRKRDGALHIGALTRQATLERSRLAAADWPLLPAALRWVGHVQTRNRGTVGGSIAHADAAAELPTALAALDGRVHVRSLRGARTIPWRELFVTHYTTSVAPDELIVEIELPAPPPGARAAFLELARRHGDFALAGAAVVLTLDDDGVCRAAAIAPLAGGATPTRVEAAEQALVGRPVDERSAREAGELVAAAIAPPSDQHASAAYRRRLAAVLVRRAVLEAAVR